MKNEIGIAIIDIYGQVDLDACYNSNLDYYRDNTIIVSDTRNTLPDCEVKQYGKGVPMATLRNWAINHFRIKGLKHFFLLNSNQIVKDPEIFEKIIKTAEVFGTWFILGPTTESVTSIEDDEHNITLNLAENITSDFIYIYNGVVSNVGFFDERYFNTKHMDILDYTIRMREKKVYPPSGYNPVFQEGLEMTNGAITKPNYREMENPDHSVNMSYAYFLTRHNYMPGQNDPKPISKDDLMVELGELQKNYAKK